MADFIFVNKCVDKRWLWNDRCDRNSDDDHDDGDDDHDKDAAADDTVNKSHVTYFKGIENGYNYHE